MKPSTALKLLAFALTSLSAGSLSAAAAERPRLQDYPSSYEFLQAMQVWKQAHPEGASPAGSSSAKTGTPAERRDQSSTVDPTSELAPPPFEINGPESLDVAVEKARDLLHPDYKEKIRYQRSTHLSFPLHTIDGHDMSQASVSDSLDIQGKTASEKKAELENLTAQLNQDQRTLQEKALADGPQPLNMPQINESMLASGPKGRVEITVSGH